MKKTQYLLICEGKCNPQIEAIDALVRDNYTPGDLTWGIAPWIAEGQRKLQYTPHVYNGSMAVCAVCLTARKY